MSLRRFVAVLLGTVLCATPLLDRASAQKNDSDAVEDALMEASFHLAVLVGEISARTWPASMEVYVRGDDVMFIVCDRTVPGGKGVYTFTHRVFAYEANIPTKGSEFIIKGDNGKPDTDPVSSRQQVDFHRAAQAPHDEELLAEAKRLQEYYRHHRGRFKLAFPAR